MNFIQSQLSHIAQHLAQDDFHILEFEKEFPVDIYKKIVMSAINEVGLQKKDTYDDYLGLGLQYSDGKNPFFDAVNALSFVRPNQEPQIHRNLEANYLDKNEIGAKFQSFFDYFDSTLYLIRGRILLAKPGHTMSEHTDGFCSGTLHYVVQTHPKAKIIIDRVEYNLPANGRFFLINASRPHFIRNDSSIDRIHVTFPVNPACFKQLTKNQLAKMEKYFKQFGLDVSLYKHIRIVD